MKVQIQLALDIDPEAWAARRGIPAEQVEADVQAFATGLVHAELDRYVAQGRRAGATPDRPARPAFLEPRRQTAPKPERPVVRPNRIPKVDG